MKKDDNSLIKSTHKVECECCLKLKSCKMYITFMGAAWICKECRKGK